MICRSTVFLPAAFYLYRSAVTYAGNDHKVGRASKRSKPSEEEGAGGGGADKRRGQNVGANRGGYRH